VTAEHDPEQRRVTVTLRQTVPDTPEQTGKQPMVLPLRTALFDRQSGERHEERLLMLTGAEQSFAFEGINSPPVLSINRGFSAPVIVDAPRTPAELAFLSAHDDDPFARYEAMQQLMVGALTSAAATGTLESEAVIDAIRMSATDPSLDDAFIAEAIRLPSEAYVGDQMLIVDPEAIHAAREEMQKAIGAALEPLWRDLHARTARPVFTLEPEDKGARKLRNVALSYLVAGGSEDGPALALAQFESAHNMTERQGALAVLANGESPERAAALSAFYDRYRSNALVLDKWFQTQALAFHPDTVRIVEQLARHPDFTLANPNRVRSLHGAFAANQWAFHSGAGKGYRLLADLILALDPVNPQTAARMVPPLGRWRRFDAGRGQRMRAELVRIMKQPELSADVTEQVSKSLAD